MPSKRDYYKKEINLIPADYNGRKKKDIKIISYVLICFMFAGLMIGYSYYLENVIKEKVNQKASIETQIQNLTETENKQELILLLNTRIDAKSTAIKSFELKSPKIIPILNTLENNLPAGLSFSSLDKSEELLSIEGMADTKKTVAEFLHNLKNEDIFESVVVDTISKEEIEGNASGGFNFYMHCQFKREGSSDDDSL
jgi:Tfp pilus assembly protein PilN